MKHFRLLVPAILALLVSSCASQKRAWYLQDANPFTPEQIAESGQIRIKPLDRLTIVVNSSQAGNPLFRSEKHGQGRV